MPGSADSLNVTLPESLERHAGTASVAVVLGSGFGGLADALEAPQRVSYQDAGFTMPGSAIAGHAGELVFGRVADTPVCLFSGRIHRYQGVSALDAAYPARLAAALGCRTFVVTAAVGAVSETFSAGGVVLISDHINLTGESPLLGWPGPPGGVPFVQMRDAYDPGLRSIAKECAAEQGIELVEGVYAGVLGPAFETPAEVRYLRAIGADVVGMSTVPEVIVARALGLRVLGLALATNAAGAAGLSHTDVLSTATSREHSLQRLMADILQRL